MRRDKLENSGFTLAKVVSYSVTNASSIPRLDNRSKLDELKRIFKEDIERYFADQKDKE